MTTHELLRTNAIDWNTGTDREGCLYTTYRLTDGVDNIQIGHAPGNQFCLVTDLIRGDQTLENWDELPAILGLA